MSPKIIRTFAAVMFALGSVGITTSAGPAKAAFVSDAGLVNLFDLNNIQYRPVQTGACYNYFLDNTNQQWMLLSSVYYFRTDETGQTVPIVFAILVNVITGQVSDGGFKNMSLYATFFNRTVQACSAPLF